MSANKNKSKNMQVQPGNLTMLQQIALEGEVSALLYDINDEAEKKLITFIKLGMCKDKHILLYKNEFKKYISSEIVDNFVSCRYLNIIPTYLFADMLVSILEQSAVTTCGNTYISKFPPEIIKSKFVMVMREITTYMPYTACAILDEIQTKINSNLSFLFPIIFLLKGQAESEKDSSNEKNVDYALKVKLLSSILGIGKAPLLNLEIEEQIQKSREKDISEKLNDIIYESMKALVSPTGELKFEDDEELHDGLIFIVEKIDRISGQVVFEKGFKTSQEASSYIKRIVDEYPAISERFKFSVIVKESSN